MLFVRNLRHVESLVFPRNRVVYVADVEVLQGCKVQEVECAFQTKRRFPFDVLGPAEYVHFMQAAAYLAVHNPRWLFPLGASFSIPFWFLP